MSKKPKFKTGDRVSVKSSALASASAIEGVVVECMGFDLTFDAFSYRILIDGNGGSTVYEKNMTLIRDPLVAKPTGLGNRITIGGVVYAIKKLADGVLRKMQPIGTVGKDYFPLADRARAAVSWLGNEKHNPGEVLHWARGKSDDHLDCAARHLTENEDWDVTILPDGRIYAVLHAAQAAWRASAVAQIVAEKYDGQVIFELEVPPGGETAQDRRIDVV